MNKKAYLTVLTIVTVVCILAGLFIHVLRGAIPFMKNMIKGGKTVSQTVETGAFDSIHLDADMGDVKIITGSDYSVSYEVPDFLIPEVETDDGVLSIKAKGDAHLIKHGHFNPSMLICKMTVTVPEGTRIAELEADVDMGNLECSGMDIAIVDLSADMGNISFSNSNVKALTAEADMGNIEISGVTGNTADLGADMGNISLGGTFDVVTGECSMGSIEYNPDDKNRECSVTLKADMGSVVVSGESQGNKYSK